MPSSFMVTYTGPKRVMNVPFSEDNTFPVESASTIADIVRFERGQLVELSEARAMALVAQSPDVFKLHGDVSVPRKVAKPTPKLASGPPNTETQRVTKHATGTPHVEEINEGAFSALAALGLPEAK